MASNIGGNLVSFVIVGLLGLLGFIIKKKCRHCKSSVNSGCCTLEMDDAKTEDGEVSVEMMEVEIIPVIEKGVQTLDLEELLEPTESAIILTV